MAMEHEFKLTVAVHETSLDAKIETFPNAEPQDTLFDVMAACVEEVEKYEMQLKGKAEY